jgi:transposase
MDTILRVKRRHKVWPETLKREIVSASLVPDASVSMIARRYDVNTNQVFTWRKRYAEAPAVAPPQLLPMVVAPEKPAALSPASSPAAATDIIEIELPGGYRVRIGCNIKPAALCAVLDTSITSSQWSERHHPSPRQPWAEAMP